MPPRPVVAVVVVGWLATIGWLASEKWGGGPRAGQPPPFLVDLADEVAPQQATWLLYRGEQRIGNTETRMVPRKDGLFDLITRVRDLALDSGAAQVKVTSFWTTRTVGRAGDLVALDSRATILPRPADGELKVDATVKGRVVGGEFHRTLSFDVGGRGTPVRPEPIRLITANAFSPFEPLQKYPPLRAGQAWRASHIDPLGEVLHAARPVVAGLIGEALPVPLPDRPPPTEVAARVQDQPEEVVTPRGQRRACWVIVFEADAVTARTWVDVTDGKVIRQEAYGLGETIAFVRD